MRNHPWMKGKTLAHAELAEEMKDRLQLYSNLCKKEIEESKEKHYYGYCGSTSSKMLVQAPFESMKFADPVVQGLISECTEINTFLEKPKSAAETPEKLSDDQVNSNSDEASDENVDEKAESIVQRTDPELPEEDFIGELGKR